MKTLVKAVARVDAGGERLPSAFLQWERNGINLRKGNLHVIAGTPASGKTILAMTIVERLRLPTLYIVPDSDERTIAARYLMKATRQPLMVVEELMAKDRTYGAQHLGGLDFIRWCFDVPTLRDIKEMIEGHIELWGESPALVVIDNLKDVDVEAGEGEFSNLRVTERYLKAFAREYDTAVLALHHTSVGEEGFPCQPMSAIWGKLSQLSALVLTIAYATPYLYACPVKNRHGWCDPSGLSSIMLPANLNLMTIEDASDVRA